MIRLSKLTDYGFVLLTRFASAEGETWFTARDLADSTALPLPTVSKLLKVFSRGGVLTAQRGMYGGYKLARSAESINVAEILEIIDGPLAITECACEDRSDGKACVIEDHCPTKPHWIRLTRKIRETLASVTLQEMSEPVAETETLKAGVQAACRGGHCGSASHEPCSCGNEDLHFPGEKQ